MPTVPLAVIGTGLQVQPSFIAGLGLFATRPFYRREFITTYAGSRISRQTAVDRRQQKGQQAVTHVISCGYATGECIDGLRVPRKGAGGGSFANDGGHSGFVNNARFVWRNDGEVWLQATEDIAAGKEILASYGRGYWKP